MNTDLDSGAHRKHISAQGANNMQHLSAFETRCILAIMPLLFGSVFGWRDTDKDAAIQESECTHIPGIDGSRLNCVLFRCTDRPVKGVVLLCHPFLKYGMAYFFKHRYQAWLNAAGYHVVAFDFKGFGTSKPGGIAFADDVLSVTRWIGVALPDMPIHLLGASFGGYHALHGIARHRLAFASVVFDSVPVHITHFFARGVVGVVMRWLSRSRWAKNTGTAPLATSYSALQHCPCLFLYGDHDSYIDATEQAEIRRHCPQATITVYPDCAHLELRKNHGERYMSDIVTFLNRHDVATQTFCEPLSQPERKTP